MVSKNPSGTRALAMVVDSLIECGYRTRGVNLMPEGFVRGF